MHRVRSFQLIEYIVLMQEALIIPVSLSPRPFMLIRARYRPCGVELIFQLI